MTAYRHVVLHGARIAYRVRGDGPAVVLVQNNRRPLDFPAAQLLAERRVAQRVIDCLVSRGADAAG